MPRRPSKRRGRPPIFAKDDEGRVIYGLSSQTIIKGDRRRTRFYATFSDPRKWFGMDDLDRAVRRFLEWIQTGWQQGQGLMPAYLRKIDQEHLIPIYRYGLRKIGVSVEESSEVPDWLKGRKVRSIPLSASRVGLIYPARRFRQDANDPKVSSLLRRAGVGELSDQARYIIYSLAHELPHHPDLLDVGREQLLCVRNAARNGQRRRSLTPAEVEGILVYCS